MPAPSPSLRRVVAGAAVTTLGVTALSYGAPLELKSTAVGVAFLVATYFLVWRHDDAFIEAHGLGLGGLFSARRLEARVVLRHLGRALFWAAVAAAITFPPFWLAFRLYWNVQGPFDLTPSWSGIDRAAGEVLLVALPEEAFYRGFLQSEIDALSRRRLRLFGMSLGPGLILAALVFAVGHVLTVPHPGRLAVFFPALVFGLLRARTGGIGAAVFFHAACNLLSSGLLRGYGLR